MAKTLKRPLINDISFAALVFVLLAGAATADAHNCDC